MNIVVGIIIFSLVFTPIGLFPFSLFTNYSKQLPEQNVQDLTVSQINSPKDPYINYNLGVALYQTNKFDQAKSNFQRCLVHAKNKDLKERCYFNLGNSFYKNCLSMLPIGWEKDETDVDQAKLGHAVQEIKEAIKNYENVFELDKENNQAKTNLEKAKKLLEKLQKKIKQQQSQQNKKDKQNNDSKDKNEKNEQQQGQQSNQNSQNQPNQNQQGQENQNSNNQNQQKQDSSNRENDGNGQQNQQQQPTNNKENSSDKSGNNGKNGGQEESGKKEDTDKKDQNLKHNKSVPEENEAQQLQNNQGYGSQQENQNQGQEKQAAVARNQQGEGDVDPSKQKMMHAVLNNLQNYESNLQKAKVMQKTQDTSESLSSNQKPW